MRTKSLTYLRNINFCLVMALLAILSAVIFAAPQAFADSKPNPVSNLDNAVGGTIYIDKQPTRSNSTVTLASGFKKRTGEAWGSDSLILYHNGSGTGTWKNVATIKTANIGHTTTGKQLDLILTIDKVYLTNINNGSPTYGDFFALTDDYGPCTDSPSGYGCEVTFTMNFVYHGTETTVNETNTEIDVIYWDIDIVGPSGHTPDWSEQITKVSGYKDGGTVKNGCSLGLMNSNKTYYATKADDLEVSNTTVAVLLRSSGGKYTTTWRGVGGCGTGIGCDTKVTRTPAPPSVSKAPANQTKKKGETCGDFTITAKLPYYGAHNAPTSIVVSDVFDNALDISGATGSVAKGSSDASSKWKFAKNGQTATFTAKSTAHGGGCEGTFTFTIKGAKVKSNANLSSYTTTSDGTCWVINNKATAKVAASIGGGTATSNTAHVNVPIPVTIKYNYAGSVSPSSPPALPTEKANTYFIGDTYKAKGAVSNVTGYIFSGWYTTSACSTLWNANGQKLTSDTVNLYGKWTRITYNVAYQKNAASVGHADSEVTGATATSLHTYDVTKNLTSNGYGLLGYIFKNWNLKADGTGGVYNNAQSVINLSSTQGATVNMYAQWTPITYNVAYAKNASSVGHADSEVTGSTATSTHTYDKAKNLTSNGYGLIGYTFKGWTANANGSGTAYGNAQSVINLSSTQGATVTIYAKWEPNKYTVKFDMNKGTGSTTPNPASKADITATYDAAFSVANPSRTGYLFAGWKITGMDTVTKHYYGASDTTNALIEQTKETSFKNLRATSGTVLFTAIWKPITYDVVYYSNGGAYNNTINASRIQTCIYDVEANVFSPDGFTNTGYTFRGWSTDPQWREATSHQSLTSLESGRQPGNKILNWCDTQGAKFNLYAVWDPIVTFVADTAADSHGDFKQVSTRTYAWGTAPDYTGEWKEWAIRPYTRAALVMGGDTEEQWNPENLALVTMNDSSGMLSNWHVNDPSTPGQASTVYSGSAIKVPTTLYIHNTVWYWYASADGSFVPHPNYIFYTESNHNPESIVYADMRNVYPVIESGKQWTWFLTPVKTMAEQTLYYQDVEARTTVSLGIYPNDKSKSHAPAGFNRDYYMLVNTVFYVDWGLPVYDGVRSGW